MRNGTEKRLLLGDTSRTQQDRGRSAGQAGKAGHTTRQGTRECEVRKRTVSIRPFTMELLSYLIQGPRVGRRFRRTADGAGWTSRGAALEREEASAGGYGTVLYCTVLCCAVLCFTARKE